MAEAPKLKPEIKRVLLQKYKENTSGEITALNAVSSIFCDGIRSYPGNTKGVIQAILQLGSCLGQWAESVEDRLEGHPHPPGGGADLCCLLPLSPHHDYDSAGIIGDDCHTENCPPTSHPHPHLPGYPHPHPDGHGPEPHPHPHPPGHWYPQGECGQSPDINPDFKYPLAGVECLHPDAYEWVNGGIVGTYCTKTHATPDCLVPSRLPYANAGTIGCGNPLELHWVDYYWPARNEWCNAGFTGHNCTECEDPLLMPHGGATADCNVCRRGGVENYRPEFIEYNNAGTKSDSCPTSYGKPVCLIPTGDHFDAYVNAGLVGTGDPDTENYVDHYWPARCEYANGGLIGTGCAIGGDEWLDALDMEVEKGDCYIPFRSEYANSGLVGGSWKCDTGTKPHGGEHLFTPSWELDYSNSGALLIPELESSEEVFGGVECWEPTADEYTQCGFQSDHCAGRDAAPTCLLPGHEEYQNGGVVAVFTESRLNWWDHYLPECPQYDNAGITGTNCEPPEDCCDSSGNALPLVPDLCHTHECWEPQGECDYLNAGFVSSRECNVCEPCDNSPQTGEPVVVVSDAAPVAPCEGMLWFQPTRLEMMIYYCDTDTCQWVPAATTLGGTGGAQAKISDTPPIGAACGDLWHDSVRQEMRVFYDDGNTRQWVPVSLAKANSTETERAMRRELDSLKNEIAELKLALAGTLPD